VHTAQTASVAEYALRVQLAAPSAHDLAGIATFLEEKHQEQA